MALLGRSPCVPSRLCWRLFGVQHVSTASSSSIRSPGLIVRLQRSDGKESVAVHGRNGQTILKAAKAASDTNGVEWVEGSCGGKLACTTCHVVVADPKIYKSLPPPTEEELDMLDTLPAGLRRPTSRLCCQVRMTHDLDGALFIVPSEQRDGRRLRPQTKLLGMPKAEVQELVEGKFGQPRWRAEQLIQRLYTQAKAPQRGANPRPLAALGSVSDLHLWPQPLREALVAAGVDVGRNRVTQRRDAKDGTVKLLLKLLDTGDLVECVGIPATNAGGSERLTVCVSSQVGCAQGCSFCATGKMKLTRSLSVHEVVDQVLQVQEQMGRRATHVVFMGMGEPMANFDVTVKSVRALNELLGIGMRNITLSTVGVPGTIPRLAREDLQATLAVSLHAPTQRLRSKIVPSAVSYPLQVLLQDCKDYVRLTGRRLSFEYCLLRGVNDSLDDARELANLMRGWQVHLNVIPWNPIGEADFRRPPAADVESFCRALGPQVSVTVRQTRGLEDAMACGQLRVEAKALEEARSTV